MLYMIWAQDKNNGIGIDNKIPWNIKEEMQHFRNTTLNKTVVMGRKTYDSIGKALPKRTNIIMTRDSSTRLPDATICSDLKEIVTKAKKDDIYIIGGKSIYEQFMPYANVLIVSQINKEFKCDTFMKPIDTKIFKLDSTDNSNKEFIIKKYVCK